MGSSAWTDQVFKWLGFGRFRASPTAVGDGQVAELLTDAVGRLQVALSAAAPAGVVAVRQLTAANEGALKAAGPGSLVEVALWNNGAVPLWFQVHDKSAAVVGGDACVDQVMVPAGGAMGWRPAVPVAAATRLRWAASTTPGTCTVPGVAALGFSGAVL